MYTVDEIHRALVAKAAGTPYTVSPIPGGLLVHLDVADLHWMTLLHDNRLSKEYSIEVLLDEAAHTYTREQIIRDVTWTAGVDPGSFVPQISASRGVQRGTVVEKSFSMSLGVDASTGRLGPVGYAFDSRQMSTFVNEAMEPSGWKKKLDRSSRIGLIVALSAVGGIVLAGLITLVILLIVL